LKAIPEEKEQNPLLNLRELVEGELDKVDELIFSLIASKIDLIPEISEHTISSGGKRLRPILTLASSKMCGYENSDEANINLAACVEFIHTATLLHDDVVDKSDLRRGKVTANSLWGNKESILVGDFLLGKAFSLMGSAKSLDVYRILSNAAVVISEGEVMQLAATGNIEAATRQYEDIIKAKTAELFAAACEVGGVISNKSEAECAALRDYGMNLGIAFQIADDVLDYSQDAKLLGKNVGDDFKDRKVTLPLIIAYKQANEIERGFWERVIDENHQEEGDLEDAISLIKKHNALEKSMQKAMDYADSARKSMDIFPDSDIKPALLSVLDFAVQRKF